MNDPSRLERPLPTPKPAKLVANAVSESSAVAHLGMSALARLAREAGAAGREAVTRRAVGPAQGAAPILASTTGQVGMEDPRDERGAVPFVERAFAFVDLCGFTNFIASSGEHAAIDALGTLRGLAREIATRRGVRVDKWLGDGAMIVGIDIGPTIAAAVELIARCDGQLALRGGVAHGRVLLLDGDDYIGRPVNLAARLCQAASSAELLAVGYPPETLPTWTRVLGTKNLTLRGLGRISDVQRIGVAPGLDRVADHPVERPPGAGIVSR